MNRNEIGQQLWETAVARAQVGWQGYQRFYEEHQFESLVGGSALLVILLLTLLLLRRRRLRRGQQAQVSQQILDNHRILQHRLEEAEKRLREAKKEQQLRKRLAEEQVGGEIEALRQEIKQLQDSLRLLPQQLQQQPTQRSLGAAVRKSAPQPAALPASRSPDLTKRVNQAIATINKRYNG